MQRVLVVQRDNMGAGKVVAVKELSEDIELKVVDVKGPFPPIVDYPGEHFPPELMDGLAWCDIVVDHLYHADLTGYLLEKAQEAGKPVVASGRKVPGAVCPTTCCTLGHMNKLGAYGKSFGMPEVEVLLNEDDSIKSVKVVRGAPCGATWKAAEKLTGLKASDAAARFGLETQFNCLAKSNPNVFLTNPLHVAGDVHAAAIEKAMTAAHKKIQD